MHVKKTVFLALNPEVYSINPQTLKQEVKNNNTLQGASRVVVEQDINHEEDERFCQWCLRCNQTAKGNNDSLLSKLNRVDDKCNDFSNYKSFLTVNLKFLKQNYKLKEILHNNNTEDKTSYNPDNVLYLHQNMGLSENETSNKENTNNNSIYL